VPPKNNIFPLFFFEKRAALRRRTAQHSRPFTEGPEMPEDMRGGTAMSSGLTDTDPSAAAIPEYSADGIGV
jgi:hypothetical protein